MTVTTYRVYMSKKQKSIPYSPYKEFSNRVDTESYIRYLNKHGIKPHVTERKAS